MNFEFSLSALYKIRGGDGSKDICEVLESPQDKWDSIGMAANIIPCSPVAQYPRSLGCFAGQDRSGPPYVLTVSPYLHQSRNPSVPLMSSGGRAIQSVRFVRGRVPLTWPYHHSACPQPDTPYSNEARTVFGSATTCIQLQAAHRRGSADPWLHRGA